MRTHNYHSEADVRAEIDGALLAEMPAPPPVGLIRQPLRSPGSVNLPWAEAVMESYVDGCTALERGSRFLPKYGWVLDVCEVSEPRRAAVEWWAVVEAAVKALGLTKAEVVARLHGRGICHIPGCDVVCDDDFDFSAYPGLEG